MQSTRLIEVITIIRQEADINVARRRGSEYDLKFVTCPKAFRTQLVFRVTVARKYRS